MIGGLHADNSANRAIIFDFAGRIATQSSNLLSLILRNTNSNAKEGKDFLETLVKAELSSLQTLEISDSRKWFEGKKRCVPPLLEIITRCTGLKSLQMEYNMLSKAQ